MKACNILKLLLIYLLTQNSVLAQTIPFQIQNTSGIPDDELYVTIVGEDLSGPPPAHVWIDCKTGTMLPMSQSYNTVQGPVYGGNRGPGLNGKYAACFTKLSEIPNKTIQLPKIQGCRMFISRGSQLYFYFFGSTGAPSGYTSPSHTDPTDPNKGIQYELIELTYNQYGFWGNTTRVDSYNYPMGLELTNQGGQVIKAGEFKTHAEIGAAYLASVPAEFQGCYNPLNGSITFPTKTEAFADGTVGTMPNIGPYVNYMKPYIDAIWSKYSNEDLIFSAGDAGIWKGRVQSNDRLVMVAQTGGFTGRIGIIERRPTTQEAFEGKGVLDRIIQDAPTDLMIQAQLCAAITRHVVNTTTPNVGQQNWSNPATYYQQSPCNHYAKFWHQQGISVDQLSYGFAYDDVFNQSSTLHAPAPAAVLVVFGGYASTAIAQGPYGGTATKLPGTLEAEHYDVGGAEVAFHELSASNEGGEYRTDAVDIESNSDGFNVGWIQSGEWLEYTVEITSSGTFNLGARVAATTSGKSFRIELDGAILATVQIPNTGDWQAWQTVSAGTIVLNSGTKILRIVAASGDFNLDNITVSSIATSTLSTIESKIFSLYPNPTQQWVHIENNEAINGVEVSVLTTLGTEVRREKIQDSRVNLESLSPGMYILVWYNNSQRIGRSILKD